MVKRWFVPIIIIALFLLLAICGSAFGITPFKIESYVTDQAGLLSETERSQLAVGLDEYAKTTSNQILVVTIPSLENEELIDFTEKLFEINKPGQKGKDNGIIYLVALKEHQVRLEVGYGLEAVLPDGKAGAIIREQITPFFKNNDYYGGISSGINAVITTISPDYSLGKNVTVPIQRRRERFNPFAVLAAILFFVIFSIGNIGRSTRAQQNRHRRGFSEPWYWGGGGFGGGSSGGGFGGGSSGGGFSGGGGSFGGGGSSGSW